MINSLRSLASVATLIDTNLMYDDVKHCGQIWGGRRLEIFDCNKAVKGLRKITCTCFKFSHIAECPGRRLVWGRERMEGECVVSWNANNGGEETRITSVGETVWTQQQRAT